MQDKMFVAVNHDAFFLRVRPPEHKDDVLAAFVQRTDNGIGKRLPAAFLMGPRGGGAHGQCGVEQQDSLPRPSREIAALGHGHAEFRLDLLIDVFQARRQGHAFAHGKRQAVRLIGAVIGVLAEHHDAHPIEGRGREGVKDIVFARIDRMARRFFRLQKFIQGGDIGLAEFSAYGVTPSGIEFYGGQRHIIVTSCHPLSLSYLHILPCAPSRRPGPLEIESAEMSRHIDHFADEIKPLLFRALECLG